MDKILVVCVGNICRSPTAEAALKVRLPRMQIWSAGLAALVGEPADPLAQEVAAEHGLDLSSHRAQQLTSWMCTQAELILVMEIQHKQELERQYPYTRGKVHCLGVAQPGQTPADIADPYRHPRNAFDTAYLAIEQGASFWADRLRLLS